MSSTYLDLPIFSSDPYAVPYEDDFSTTFWQDFSIADRFGRGSVIMTFNSAFNEWKSDYRYLTDLVTVLNHKIYQHFESDKSLAVLYDKLWKEADAYAMETLKGDAMDYFLRVTD